MTVFRTLYTSSFTTSSLADVTYNPAGYTQETDT
jgi:hypothetical protein